MWKELDRLPQLDLQIHSRAVIQTLDQPHHRKLGAYCVCQYWLEVFSCRLIDYSDSPGFLAIISLDFRKISVRSADGIPVGGEIASQLLRKILLTRDEKYREHLRIGFGWRGIRFWRLSDCRRGRWTRDARRRRRGSVALLWICNSSFEVASLIICCLLLFGGCLLWLPVAASKQCHGTKADITN